MIEEKMSTFNIHKLTEEQYQSAYAAGEIDELALYLTPGEEQDTSVSSAAAFSLNKVVCIGDSFCHGWYDSLLTTGDVPYGWGEALRDIVRRYNPAAKFALNYEGGSGFVTEGQYAGNTFTDHVTNLADMLTEASANGLNVLMVGDDENGYKEVDVIRPNDVETVIFVGGINDINACLASHQVGHIARTRGVVGVQMDRHLDLLL